jgi:uncharacterized protein YndB with AHSA1/START domain
MAFPDRIERTVDLAHPPAKVWTAITSADGLGTWFGQSAEVDLRPGGEARLTWAGGYTATLHIKVVEPTSRFAYTWGIDGLPEGDPRQTFVDFLLEPSGAGTRLTVVETGFAQVPEDAFDKAYNGNVEGWEKELGELVAYLDAGR